MMNILRLSFIVFSISLISLTHTVEGQSTENSLERFRSRYEMREYESIYRHMWQIMRSGDPSYYLCLANTNQLSSPQPDFRGKLGELDQSLLEMRLAQRFNIIRGKESYSGDFWSRSQLLTANFDFVYRIGNRRKEDKTSDDSPGHPLNTKFGLTLWEQALFLKRNAYDKFRKDNWKDETVPFIINQKKLSFWSFRLDFMHYSNGQDFGALVFSRDSSKYRNDYLSGNFSTNYIEPEVSFYHMNEKGQLWDLSVSYENHFAIGKWLTYEPAQENRYGRHFLNFNLHYRSGPQKFRKIKDLASKRQKEDINNLEISNKNKRKSKKNINKVNALWELALKVSYSHLLDKVVLPSEIPATNNTTDFTLKNGIDIEIEFIPLFSPDWSIFISGYYGRDYLNIRYDLPVFIVKGLLSFTINRYTPPRSVMLQKIRQL